MSDDPVPPRPPSGISQSTHQAIAGLAEDASKVADVAQRLLRQRDACHVALLAWGQFVQAINDGQTFQEAFGLYQQAVEITEQVLCKPTARKR